MTPLSKPRKELLDRLRLAGGSLAAERLPVPTRRLATMMQRDGLVRWEVNGGIGSRHTLKGQTVFLTERGANILYLHGVSEDGKR